MLKGAVAGLILQRHITYWKVVCFVLSAAGVDMKMIFDDRSSVFLVSGYLQADSGFFRYSAYGADALVI
jgi:hypothetical protein